MAKSLRRKLREISLEGAYSAEENARLILEERTQHLAARRLVDPAPKVAARLVLVCSTGGERYGIALDEIAEVLPVQTCVPVPEGPPALVGFFGRRGHLVSVIDLGGALGTSAAPTDAVFHHLVLLRREHLRVALRVERAQSVTPATPLAAEEGQTFRSEAVTGYAEAEFGASGRGRVLSLLDVERLIRPFLPPSPVSGV
ncbi:MAG: chemotaxis protein CheW [Microvirga sp.]|jgi:purine-binding chemotaxis protein CheW|nr:chemotaxis protein CheW [Microvirga sp.]